MKLQSTVTGVEICSTVEALLSEHRAVQLAMEHSTILKALRLTLLILQD